MKKQVDEFLKYLIKKKLIESLNYYSISDYEELRIEHFELDIKILEDKINIYLEGLPIVFDEFESLYLLLQGIYLASSNIEYIEIFNQYDKIRKKK